MASALRARSDALLDELRKGRFAEAIEVFYAPDAAARENAGPVTQGRGVLAANERRFREKVKAYHGIEVLARAIDERTPGTGTVLYECVMRWDQADRGAVTVEQVVVERWKDGCIHEIRFYGNFDPGPLPS